MSLRFIFSILKPNFSKTIQAAKTISEEKKINHSTNQNGFLYIWTRKPGSVGHVAIQLGGDAPKRSEQQSGIYRSIWPKFPAVGLTTIMPLKAALATNLEHDEQNEAKGMTSPPSPINIMFDVDPVYSKENELVKPDYTYEIKNLNEQKMYSELEKLDRGIEKGEIRYQLFPNFNPLKYLHFKQVLRHFTKTHDTDSKEDIIKTSDRYDCATFAHQILTAGGASLGKPTWSPTKFKSVIEKSPEHFVPFHEQQKSSVLI